MKIQNEQGRTMLEMLGVIAIIGIITYGAIAGINYGMQTYKINQTYNDVQDIIQGVEDLYSWSRSGYPTDGSITNAVIKNGIFSSDQLTCNYGGGAGNNVCMTGQLEKMWVVGVAAPHDVNTFVLTLEISDEAIAERLNALDWKSVNIFRKREPGNGSNHTMQFSPFKLDGFN